MFELTVHRCAAQLGSAALDWQGGTAGGNTSVTSRQLFNFALQLGLTRLTLPPRASTSNTTPTPPNKTKQNKKQRAKGNPRTSVRRAVELPLLNVLILAVQACAGR